MRKTKSNPVAFAVGLATVGAVTLMGITGCSQIRQQVGDAWSVTYEVAVDQAVGAQLDDVSIDGADRRGEAPTTHAIGQVTTTTRPKADTGSVWREELAVLAEDRATVVATPADGAVATCRVLLDGKRVIAEKTGAPGASVKCSVTTPAFDKSLCRE